MVLYKGGDIYYEKLENGWFIILWDKHEGSGFYDDEWGKAEFIKDWQILMDKAERWIRCLGCQKASSKRDERCSFPRDGNWDHWDKETFDSGGQEGTLGYLIEANIEVESSGDK